MKALQTLADKEVSRKEFLTIVAFGVLSILGIGSIIKLVTGKHPDTRINQYMSGYSSNDYGNKSEL